MALRIRILPNMAGDWKVLGEMEWIRHGAPCRVGRQYLNRVRGSPIILFLLWENFPLVNSDRQEKKLNGLLILFPVLRHYLYLLREFPHSNFSRAFR